MFLAIYQLLLPYRGTDHHSPSILTHQNDRIGIYHVCPEVKRSRWRLRSCQLHRIPLRRAQRPVTLQCQQPIHRNSSENFPVPQFSEVHHTPSNIIGSRARDRNHAHKILFKTIHQIHAAPINRVAPRHRSRRERPALHRDGPVRNHIGRIILNKPLRRRSHVKNILKGLITRHIREVQRAPPAPPCINGVRNVAESTALRERIYPSTEILIHAQIRDVSVRIRGISPCTHQSPKHSLADRCTTNRKHKASRERLRRSRHCGLGRCQTLSSSHCVIFHQHQMAAIYDIKNVTQIKHPAVQCRVERQRSAPKVAEVCRIQRDRPRLQRNRSGRRSAVVHIHL